MKTFYVAALWVENNETFSFYGTNDKFEWLGLEYNENIAEKTLHDNIKEAKTAAAQYNKNIKTLDELYILKLAV